MAEKLYEVKLFRFDMWEELYEVVASSEAGAIKKAKREMKFESPAEQRHIMESYGDMESARVVSTVKSEIEAWKNKEDEE